MLFKSCRQQFVSKMIGSSLLLAGALKSRENSRGGAARKVREMSSLKRAAAAWGATFALLLLLLNMLVLVSSEAQEWPWGHFLRWVFPINVMYAAIAAVCGTPLMFLGLRGLEKWLQARSRQRQAAFTRLTSEIGDPDLLGYWLNLLFAEKVPTRAKAVEVVVRQIRRYERFDRRLMGDDLFGTAMLFLWEQIQAVRKRRVFPEETRRITKALERWITG